MATLAFLFTPTSPVSHSSDAHSHPRLLVVATLAKHSMRRPVLLVIPAMFILTLARRSSHQSVIQAMFMFTAIQISCRSLRRATPKAARAVPVAAALRCLSRHRLLSTGSARSPPSWCQLGQGQAQHRLNDCDWHSIRTPGPSCSRHPGQAQHSHTRASSHSGDAHSHPRSHQKSAYFI